MRRRDFLLGCACAACAGVARPGVAGLPAGLVEPHMHFVPTGTAPQVAVTLDACMGDVDMRILTALITNRIAATTSPRAEKRPRTMLGGSAVASARCGTAK